MCRLFPGFFNKEQQLEEDQNEIQYQDTTEEQNYDEYVLNMFCLLSLYIKYNNSIDNSMILYCNFCIKIKI